MALPESVCRPVAVLGFLALLSGCVVTPGDAPPSTVHCSIQSIELSAADPFIAMPGSHELQGRAHVRCMDTDGQSRLLSLGLVDSADTPAHALYGERSAKPVALLYFFADAALQTPMPRGPDAQPAVSVSLRLVAGTPAELILPFHARLVTTGVLPAGVLTKPSALRVRVSPLP